MGGAFGKNDSRSANRFNFSQNIPGFQKDALTKLYGQAEDLFKNFNSQVQRQMPGATKRGQQYLNKAMPAFLQQLNGGAYAGLNGNQIAANLMRGGPSATQQLQASIMGGQGNNYADAMKGQYMQDAQRASDQMMSNLDARISDTGMSGGARHGVAQAMGMRDINSNLQRNLAETGFNTFDKDLDRKLGIAQQADTNTLQRQNMLTDMLGQKNNTIANAINNTGNMAQGAQSLFSNFMAPWAGLQNYTSTIGSPTVLSSGGGAGRASSKGKSGSGGIGGGK
jgi:hypothetical protein